jgi:hypothetical protein
MRLTFVRNFFPDGYAQRSHEHTLQMLETPVEPWLLRFTAGEALTSFLPDLTAATAGGRAALLHTELCTFAVNGGWGWKRVDTQPWMSFADYMNPSIHDGRFCFNPRYVTGSIPACLMEAGVWGYNATVCGEPVRRRFGLWLTDAPGYSAETSAISLSEWPRLAMSSLVNVPRGRDLVLHASLGRSWSHPEQAALHWLLFRNAGPSPATAEDEAPAVPVPPTVSFTITGSDGAVSRFLTLPAGTASIEDGRMVQTLEPRAVDTKFYFQETVPPDAPGGGKTMDGQPTIAMQLDGTQLNIINGQWTLEHSLVPARKITETLTAMTEQPADGDYRSENVSVSCERLVMRREKLTGPLPDPGTTTTKVLDGGRTLTVQVR